MDNSNVSALTMPEISFASEVMALGPLGMRVWCPTGIEVTMEEEVQRVNPPGWNLMQSRIPLDVAINDGVLPMKPESNPQAAEEEPVEDTTLQLPDDNYDVNFNPETGNFDVEPKPRDPDQPPPPPYDPAVNWKWSEEQQTYVQEIKKDMSHYNPGGDVGRALPALPSKPAGASDTTGDWIGVITNSQFRWFWQERSLPPAYAPETANSWGAYVWRRPQQRFSADGGSLQSTEVGHWRWLERAGQKEDGTLVWRDTESNEYMTAADTTGFVWKGERFAGDALLPSKYGETLTRETVGYRETLSWSDKFVYDLQKHLEDNGHNLNSAGVTDNAGIFLDSFLWGFDGGFMEKDHPELQKAWMATTLLFGWELGTIGAVAGKAAQLGGRGIAAAARGIASSAVRGGQRLAQMGFRNAGQALARGGSQLLAQNATRLGRQLEQWGVLKLSDISTRGALAQARQFIARAPAEIRKALASMSQMGQRVWWYLTEHPDAVQRLVRQVPSLRQRFASMLSAAGSPQTFRNLATSLATGVRNGVAAEWSKAVQLWNRAGRLLTLGERQAFRQQSNVFSGLRQGTRNLSRRRNIQALNNAYDLSADAASLQRRGMSASQAIEQQLASEMTALRNRRPLFSSTMNPRWFDDFVSGVANGNSLLSI